MCGKPVYELLGHGLRVHFAALQSALFKAPKASPKVQHDTLNVGLDVGLNVGLENKILNLVQMEPTITMASIAKKQNVTQRTVERVMKNLREEGRIVRKGGKRYGYWEIL